VVKRQVKDAGRNALITDFVKQAYKSGRTIILFSDAKAHLTELRERLMKDHKIPPTDMSYYVGGMSESAREKAKTKRILLATYQFVSTGTNIPWLDCGVLATPRSDVVQIVGRVLREYPDKKQPVIFDLVDSDSWVFAKYASNREGWYRSIGAKIKNVNPY
jgi:superfamily II DNA or RNA helicase